MLFDLLVIVVTFAFVLFCHGVSLWLRYVERQNTYRLRNERRINADTESF